MDTISARLPFSRGPLLALVAAAICAETLIALVFVARPVQMAALAIAVSMTVIAVLRPPLMATIAWLAIALVPVYAAPEVGPVVFHAAVGAFWLVALGSAVAIRAREERLSFSVVDVGMALFIIMAMTSVLVGGRPMSDFMQAAFVWLGCYLGMRLLFSYDLTPEWLSQRFVLAGLVVLPLVLYEVATGDNPFFAISVNGKEAEIWATAQDRFGTPRVEAAFGHAIALGMFLASAAVFCISMALHRRGQMRWLWVGLAAAFVAAMVPTVSRTGWVVLSLGVVLLAVGTADRMGRRWLAGLVGTVIAAVVLLSVAVPQESIGVGGLSGSTVPNSSEVRGSNLQRQILLDNALTSDALTLFGSGLEPKLANGTGTGNDSVDNAYLALADSWGIVPAAAFGFLGLTLIGAILRSRRDRAWSVVPAVALANFIGLLFVALITQQEFFIFALVGAAAAFDSRLGEMT
jgi:hypothetical protein